MKVTRSSVFISNASDAERGIDALSAPSGLYDYYNPESYAVVQSVRFKVQ